MQNDQFNMFKAALKIVLALFMALLVSCNEMSLDKDDINGDSIQDISDLKAPTDFKWKTSQTVSMVVDIASESDYKSKISVYNANPLWGGELLETGSVSANEAFVTQLDVPVYLKSLYIVCEKPTGANEGVEVEITEGTVVYSFISEAEKKAALRSIMIAPSCESNCDREVSGEIKKLTIENGETVCVTGILDGSVTFANGGGTLKVCGTARIKNVNYNGGNLQANIIITSSGSLYTSNINLNNSAYSLTNWGYFDHKNNMSTPGTFKNYGIANISSFNVNQNGVLENYNDFNVLGHMNNNSKVYNYGFIDVSGHYNNNGQSMLENYCQMIVRGNFAQNEIMHNYGYIYCGAAFRINGGTTNEMYSGAMIKCTDLHINSNLNGNRSTSGISISKRTYVNGSGSVTGTMDICDNNGIEHNNGVIDASVTFCEAYIATTSCNPDGYGEAPVVEDADEDGIVDDQDEFPDDPNRAFTSYFISENGSASIVFEDLWPSKGDYDFNDLVLGVSGTRVLNSENKVVEVFLDFKVRAVGAANINGFGLQLPTLLGSAVESVTGAVYKNGSTITLDDNGTEAGQMNAVVIAVENIEDIIHRSEGAMFNTVKNGFVGTSDLVQLHILFGEDTPVDNQLINFGDLDIFLICNQERGWEIHAADITPTNLVSDFWGSNDDTSEPSVGRFFKTENNLPWAMVIIEDFKYPTEKTSILDAYPQFKDWAISGGVENQDWYLYPEESLVW